MAHYCWPFRGMSREGEENTATGATDKEFDKWFNDSYLPTWGWRWQQSNNQKPGAAVWVHQGGGRERVCSGASINSPEHKVYERNVFKPVWTSWDPAGLAPSQHISVQRHLYHPLKAAQEKCICASFSALLRLFNRVSQLAVVIAMNGGRKYSSFAIYRTGSGNYDEDDEEEDLWYFYQ